jgi:serine/threonine protein kinase
MEMPDDPYLGQMIRGYRLEERLGQGKVTSLYRARTQELWQVPELTVVLLHQPENLSAPARDRFLARFEQEAERSMKLRHASLFPLFAYEIQGECCYLLMPDTSGITLAGYFKRRQRWLPVDIFSILSPIAQALDYIHTQGLIHQYLTPGSIIFPDGEPPRIIGLRLEHMLRLAGLDEETDLGAENAHLFNIARMPIGMAEYLAPEVIKGENVDKRADVYTLGIILFEMLCGRPPYQGKSYMETAQMHVWEPLPSLHEIDPELPLALEVVVDRALHRDPHRRYSTPGEMLAAYAQALDKHQQTARTVHQMTKQTQPLNPASYATSKYTQPLSPSTLAALLPQREGSWALEHQGRRPTGATPSPGPGLAASRQTSQAQQSGASLAHSPVMERATSSSGKQESGKATPIPLAAPITPLPSVPTTPSLATGTPLQKTKNIESMVREIRQEIEKVIRYSKSADHRTK